MKRLSFLTTLFLILGISQFVQAQAPSMPVLAKDMIKDEMVYDPIFQEFSKISLEMLDKVNSHVIDFVGIMEYILSMPEEAPEEELSKGIEKQAGGGLYLDYQKNLKELAMKLNEKYPQIKDVFGNKAKPSREEMKTMLANMKARQKN
jgi:hypothetical protein